MKVGDLIEHPPSGALGIITYIDVGYGWAEVMLAALGKHDIGTNVGEKEHIDTKFWRKI